MKKMLLHVCCAPCATYIIEKLSNNYKITLFFYNPNIMPKEEYEKRLLDVKKIAEYYNVNLLIGVYENDKFLVKIKGLEEQEENSVRCLMCYQMRLLKTAEIAKEFDVFTTTLTISPYKDSDKINLLGSQISDKFVAFDHKLEKGYEKSIELSHKLNLYRQKYCGCLFN